MHQKQQLSDTGTLFFGLSKSGTPLAFPDSRQTTMLRLKAGQRRVLIDRLSELANFIVGSMFFGQFLIERPFSLALGVTSIALWVALIGVTFWLDAGNEP